MDVLTIGVRHERHRSQSLNFHNRNASPKPQGITT
jgi:hypothetical protein